MTYDEPTNLIDIRQYLEGKPTKKLNCVIDMTTDEVIARIQGYLKRSETDTKVQKIPLEEPGLYRIVGGHVGPGTMSQPGEHPELVIVQGRFIDAISRAVRLSSFYGDWCPSDIHNMGNPHHGYIQLIAPIQLSKDEGLECAVAKAILDADLPRQ